MSSSPVLTVVMPTFNRRERLDQVLRSLAAQDLDEPFEVVVVSDGSTDGTNEYLRSSDPPLDIVGVVQDNQGPAGARNTGVERASADLVVFVDDDVVADPGLLRAHLDAHERHGPDAVVIGPMLDPDDHDMSPWIAWEQTMLAKQYEAMLRGDYDATARQFYTGNSSLRTRHLRDAGGFDPTFRRAEDIELAYRLSEKGLTFHFEPDAVGLHYAERPYESWRNTAYVYGRNDIVFARAPGREWLYGFVADVYWRHHPAIRLIVDRSVASPRWRTSLTRVFERLLRLERLQRTDRAARYLLSGVYAIEYHNGVADELGSAEAYRTFVRQRKVEIADSA